MSNFRTSVFLLLTMFLINQGFSQWQAQDPGFPDGIAPLYPSVVDENVVWVVAGHEVDRTPYAGFSKTVDGGKTWQADTIDIEGIAGFRFTSIFARNDSVAWVTMVNDQSNPVNGRLLKTIDGGISWQHQATAYPEDDVSAHVPNFVHFFDKDNGISAGYFGEIFYTSNGGDLWEKVSEENKPSPINNEKPFNTNVWSISDSIAWFGTDQGRLFKTTDKGHSWQAYDVGLGTSTVFASFKDSLNGLATTPIINRNIAKTVDGGKTWQTLDNELPINALIIYIKGTDNTYMYGSGDLPYFVGSNPGSGFTLDDGNSFFGKTDIPLDPLYSADPFTGWAVGSTYDKDIYKWNGPDLNEIPVEKDYYELDIVYTPRGFYLGNYMATLCIPRNPNGAGVVLAHGSYSAGPFQRETMKIWCDTLAANGYTAMTIDYYDIDNTLNEQVDSSAAYPGQATTLKHAVEFLRKNTDRFKILSDKIVAFGTSAGAFHWAQTITWENDDAFFETDPDIDDHVDAAVLLYGAYDNYLDDNAALTFIRNKHFINYPELAATKGNPIVNTANINTPVFLVHGTADSHVQYQHSVNYNDSLKANGKSSQFITYRGREHVFELTNYFPPHEFTEDGLDLKNKILSFLDSTVVSPVSDIQNKTTTMVETFKLQQNYPNPFNPLTMISYKLPIISNVELSVYNIMGQKVNTLVSGRQQAGRHFVNFDATRISSGIYFYQLSVNGKVVETKKMTLIK